MTTVEQLEHNIFRIGVPLLGNPLKELNSYYIKGLNFDLLIDTGFRTKECEEALREGLEILGSDPARRHLAITHLHADHASMGDLFAGPGNPVYMSAIDCERLLILNANKRLPLKNDPTRKFQKMGFTDEMLDFLDANSPNRTFYMDKIKELNFKKLCSKDIIDMGDRKLEWVLVPGHTPGNSMIWDNENKIMFTGDHILFDITPNITSWDNFDNSLGKYLDGLKYAASFPVRLALPGHRKTGDYHARIASIEKHHERRLNEVIETVKKEPGLNTMEIAGTMTWKIRANSWDDFPIVQKFFAVGECQAHLDYLVEKGIISKEENDIWRYYYKQD